MSRQVDPPFIEDRLGVGAYFLNYAPLWESFQVNVEVAVFCGGME